MVPPLSSSSIDHRSWLIVRNIVPLPLQTLDESSGLGSLCERNGTVSGQRRLLLGSKASAHRATHKLTTLAQTLCRDQGLHSIHFANRPGARTEVMCHRVRQEAHNSALEGCDSTPLWQLRDEAVSTYWVSALQRPSSYCSGTMGRSRTSRHPPTRLSAISISS